jgi:hypothetical protein
MSLSIVVAVVMASAAARPPLRGAVQEADGKPLPGATVMIYTARPRVGTSTFCPSCYLDCGRSATTGADGRFEIAHVDPALLFRIVAMAKGHDAVFDNDVDPANAAEVKVSLPARPPLPDNPKRVVRGQVLGPSGPVAMAVVDAQGFVRGQGEQITRSYGNTERIVQPTVTDSAGEFEMILGEEVDALVLLVSPRGLTRRVFSRVPTGLARTRLEVSYGGGVRGRIVKEGRPVAGVAANLEQKDRDSDGFVGTYSAVSDEAGRFLIANVLPETEMLIVGASEDLVGQGYVSTHTLKTGSEGVIADVADLEVRPGRTLIGRVTLSDGKDMPPHIRVLVGREGVNDARTVELANDGSFTLDGLPEEPVSLSVRVPGYTFSKKNASLVPVHENYLLGRVQGSRRLVVLLEPDVPRSQPIRFDRETWAEIAKAQEALRQKPLAGVEGQQR